MKDQFPFLLYLSILMALSACNSSTDQSTSAEAPGDRPNVILIMTDDQGYGDLACHGNPHIKTPNLDQLHSQSIRLTNFHVGTTCAPTRAGLMTGRNCNRAGVWHTIAGRSQLRANEVTMANVFSSNDYQTAMFGKWHLGDNYPFSPHFRGFDEVLYHGGGGVVQGPDFWDNDYFDDTYFRNGQPEPQTGYCTDVWFDNAIQFMEKNRTKPFFCYIATNAPHGPFYVDSSYIKPYQGNDAIPNHNFYGMITNFDENMGRLMKKLDDLDIAENTILIYLTDNGTAAGVDLDQDGFPVKGFNVGMRGRKGSQYEGGHRVPLFIRWPKAGIAGGKDISTLTAHVDILPTLIDWLNLSASADLKFDGTSLTTLLEGNDEDPKWQERILITDTQRAETPVKWKKSATMMDQWRLINQDELYNLNTDPGQKENIAAQHPKIVEKLQAGYERWWNELEPTFAAPTRTVFGSSAAPEVVLYSHDWHEAEKNTGEPNVDRAGGHMVPWNHRQIRAGQLVNGYWEVAFEQAGNYQFELRRWPREADQAINGGLPPLAAVDGGKEVLAGKALQISKASIKVGDQEISKDVGTADKAAIFEMEVEAGPTQIKSTFEGPGATKLGAYYVYVSKL